MHTATGTVTDDSPLSVAVDGDLTDAPFDMKFAAYTPTVGDRVALIKFGSRWIVVGELEDLS